MPLTTRETLQQLPHMQRECFQAAVLERRSYAAIAARFGIEPVTVRAHVHRAKRRLRTMPDLPTTLRLAIRRRTGDQ